MSIIIQQVKIFKLSFPSFDFYPINITSLRRKIKEMEAISNKLTKLIKLPYTISALEIQKTISFGHWGDILTKAKKQEQKKKTLTSSKNLWILIKSLRVMTKPQETESMGMKNKI